MSGCRKVGKRMYTGFDYEKEPHDFKDIAQVKTSFHWGKPEEVPKPWLTVLIPTYRRTKLFREALNSVLHQRHVDFAWDIVVLDNEPEDGAMNETECLVHRINHPRVLYYRNSKNMRPGDNFNRGLQIARGKYVMFCHDDDLLVGNALLTMGRLLRAYEHLQKKPLGAISAKYIKFNYDAEKDKALADLKGMNQFLSHQPTSFQLYQLTHKNIWFTANIGGDVPSNGTTYLREAALECGGFIKDFGISGDLILFYRMEKKYRVYGTLQPLGFYRWGTNTMSTPEATRQVIQDGYDFREYVYSRNFVTRLMGKAVRASQNRLFTTEVIERKNDGMDRDKQIRLRDYLPSEKDLPHKLWYAIYVVLIRKAYFLYKKVEGRRMSRKAYQYEVSHYG